MQQLLLLAILSGNIILVWTRECTWPQHFCVSQDLCLDASEACDEQCAKYLYFCPSMNRCIFDNFPCDGKCPDAFPNLCDNGTLCYGNFNINDPWYSCVDRSDEHKPAENSPPLDTSSIDKFLQLKEAENYGSPGVDCQDGTVYEYFFWCRDQFRRMCGGVSTTDYFVCNNLSLWKDRPCGSDIFGQYVRGQCKTPGKCIQENGKCNGQVGDGMLACGQNDYSDEVCPVNEENLTKHTRYFTCKDNSVLIHPTLVCDGFQHCGDGSDENECDTCPRANNMIIHSQMIQLKAEEIRDLTHLKNTAIMQCVSPYGQTVCATPGDGILECAMELKEGVWQTQDELELTLTTLWRKILQYMSCIFLVSVVVVSKIWLLSYHFQESLVDAVILTSYRRTICFDKETLNTPITSFTTEGSSFPTPFFTTTEPKQLTSQFRQYYTQNHGSNNFKIFFELCLTLSQFLPTRKDRDVFHCGIYAIEAQIHNMSPTCTDQCLKQHSSATLQAMFDAVYGSFSDRLPNSVKNFLHAKSKLPCLYYFWRLKMFLFRYFFFYYDIVQEYVLLSFILGVAGLGISTTFWLQVSDIKYIHITIYLFISSAFLPPILFAMQLAFSSQIGIIFGIKNPSVRQRFFLGLCCLLLSPFVPTILFLKIEKNQTKMFQSARSASTALNTLNNDNICKIQAITLRHKLLEASEILMKLNNDILKAKSLYKNFKEWELAIELPIQSTLTIIFVFVKKSTTVINHVFQNWFISDTKSIFFLIGMSFKSIITVQISDEATRKNNFLGVKSKIFLIPLYMMTSITRIASIFIYVAVPLGLLDLLGHWTVESQGILYILLDFQYQTISLLTECIKKTGHNLTKVKDNFVGVSYFNSTIFSETVSSTKYTVLDISTYTLILMVILTTLVTINFIWSCLRRRKSLIENILSSAKSVLSITLHSDFDEDDESISPDQLEYHYTDKFAKVHKEYVLKLLLHTGINMALTFPWALAYQAANERHQLLATIGECVGVKGTVEMEDISLERLWWGQWILPLMMAIIGALNYGWFRVYVKYGHPWRRLLTLDKQRIEEWRTLKLWQILDNQNYNTL